MAVYVMDKSFFHLDLSAMCAQSLQSLFPMNSLLDTKGTMSDRLPKCELLFEFCIFLILSFKHYIHSIIKKLAIQFRQVLYTFPIRINSRRTIIYTIKFS